MPRFALSASRGKNSNFRWSRDRNGTVQRHVSIFDTSVSGKEPKFSVIKSGTVRRGVDWRLVETRRWRWYRWLGSERCWCIRARRSRTRWVDRCDRTPSNSCRPGRHRRRGECTPRWWCWQWRTEANRTETPLHRRTHDLRPWLHVK